MTAALDIASDDIPLMAPWFGTGVYANIYGCPYVWREDAPPAVHYRFHNMEEIRNLPKPDWRKSEIAALVLSTIKYFKSKTGDALPIAWTDTQSASDTATLILDAAEVFSGCLLEPGLLMEFMRGINEVIIAFSRVQAELIGNALIRPGINMFSSAQFKGISISDDNLAVASPQVNADFNLVLDEEIGRAMGGVAIHSCGCWTRTMKKIKEIVPSCTEIDCAVDRSQDPNPNEPEKVRDAMAHSGIPVRVRTSWETEKMLESVRRILHPGIRLIVHPMFKDVRRARLNYEALDSLMGGYFKNNPPE